MSIRALFVGNAPARAAAPVPRPNPSQPPAPAQVATLLQAMLGDEAGLAAPDQGQVGPAPGANPPLAAPRP